VFVQRDEEHIGGNAWDVNDALPDRRLPVERPVSEAGQNFIAGIRRMEAQWARERQIDAGCNRGNPFPAPGEKCPQITAKPGVPQQPRQAFPERGRPLAFTPEDEVEHQEVLPVKFRQAGNLFRWRIKEFKDDVRAKGIVDVLKAAKAFRKAFLVRVGKIFQHAGGHAQAGPACPANNRVRLKAVIFEEVLERKPAAGFRLENTNALNEPRPGTVDGLMNIR